MAEIARTDAEVLAALRVQFPRLLPTSDPAEVRAKIDQMFAADPKLYDEPLYQAAGKAGFLEASYEALYRDYLRLARLCLETAEDACAAVSREGR